jgi:protein SCO1/2
VGAPIRRALASGQGKARVTEDSAAKPKLRQVRLLLWLLVALTVAGTAALYAVTRMKTGTHESAAAAKSSFGGPFTLVGADGKPFSSEALRGHPYALYFGFTRCADVCPTTLWRLVKLRRAAASDEAMRLVFITVDPAHDGPTQVGQYASLFNAPIVGLTGTQAQIGQVKKHYGIYAEPVPNAAMGKEMMHTATVLLFDRAGQFAGTISADDSDTVAVDKIRKLVG